MKSIFLDKAELPDDAALKKALGKTFPLWKEIEKYTLNKKAGSAGSWNYSGAKFGWSYRISDKKRVIIYLLPRDGFLKTGFVFGGKAYDAVMASKVSDGIKNELKAAKPFAEGRGIRLSVESRTLLKDIKTIIEIKINN